MQVETEQERVIQFKDKVLSLFTRGDFTESLKIATDGLAYFTQHQERSGQAMAQYHLGCIYRSQGDFSASLDAFQQSENIYTLLNDKSGCAIAINGAGLTFKYIHNYSSALHCFRRSLALAEEIKDLSIETNALGNIGTIYMQINDHATALEMLHRCLVLFEAMGDDHKTAIALHNIGINYVILKDYKAAIPFLERGLDILERREDRYHIASLLDVLGAAYIGMDQFEAGLEHLHHSLAIFEALEMPRLIAMSLSRIGATFVTLGRFAEAKTVLERSLAVNNKEDDRLHYCENLVQLGTLYGNPDFSDQKDTLAIQILQEARVIAEELDKFVSLSAIHGKLSELYERQGDIQEAFACYRQMHQAEKHLFNTESDERIRTLQVRFEVAQAQQTADIAQRDAEIAHLKTVELSNALKEAEQLRIIADERAEYNQKIAEILQQAVLPTLPERVASQLAVRTFYQPASDEAAVGGDFYDVFSFAEGKTVLVVGDVIGHGLEAALSIAEMRFALRAFLSLNTNGNLGDALGQLNNFLVKTNEMRRAQEGNGYKNRLVALTLVAIDPSRQELHVVSAGMEPALLIRGDTRTVEYLDAGDMVLGVMPNILYQAQTTRIQASDLLAVTTDGITEAFGKDGKHQFGKEGLGASLLSSLSPDSLPPSDLLEIGEAALSTLRAFTGSTLRDDVCLMLTQIASV